MNMIYMALRVLTNKRDSYKLRSTERESRLYDYYSGAVNSVLSQHALESAGDEEPEKALELLEKRQATLTKTIAEETSEIANARIKAFMESARKRQEPKEQQ